ncbi:hypothetical protein CYMTET_22463 [Cymbomonas tetramitiformis]|uniref:Uncharacterized protein n=1 Tax=Cymbomonas tetramitiformis TaxID=36881 RepID=A0AAE0L239_9CHLO|nr:hypothetical protein CYMTET_22463 [Cymbomonas tetramitiformis]
MDEGTAGDDEGRELAFPLSAGSPKSPAAEEQSGASPQQMMSLAREGVLNLMGASRRAARLLEGAVGTERTAGKGVDDGWGVSEEVV